MLRASVPIALVELTMPPEYPRAINARVSQRAAVPVNGDAVNALVAYYDAAVEPFNPGGHAVGAWIVLANRTAGITEDVAGTAYYGSGPAWTANRAEYEAALSGLTAIYRLGHRGPVELRGDSLLIANHFSGAWTCGAPHLVPLLERLHHAGEVFAGLTITWIPRAENARADALTRRAVGEALRRYGRPGRPTAPVGDVAP